jgi:hypothetical protein
MTEQAFGSSKTSEIRILAGPDSTMAIHGIRLRNHRVWATEDHSDGAPTFVGAFLAEAAGDYATKEEAVGVLANLASLYFQVMSPIATAGAEEPEDLLAYSAPEDDAHHGDFVVQRHSQLRSPAERLRAVPAADAMSVLSLLMEHPRQERLQRPMAHYRMALNHLNPEFRSAVRGLALTVKLLKMP